MDSKNDVKAIHLVRKMAMLVQIDGLIRDENFVSTQLAIADRLGVSPKTVVIRMNDLRFLGAPLGYGERGQLSGFVYESRWDLRKAFWACVEKQLAN